MGRTYFFGSYNSFRPFIIKVNSGADSQFTVPTQSNVYTYNYDLETSDLQSFTGLTGNKTIIFPSANTDYIITISGIFPSWYQNNNSERLKPLDVMQWGTNAWTSFENAFFNCSNLISTAVDYPNLSVCTNMNACFYLTKFNTNVNNWNFSNIQIANRLLSSCTSYTQPIDLTDLSTGSINFTNISSAFDYIKSPSIKLICDDLTNIDIYTFLGNSFLSELILINNKVTFWINYNSLLIGTKIDDLANSVADRTGFASPTVTMTVSQKASCNNALWTAKNWTIAT